MNTKQYTKNMVTFSCIGYNHHNYIKPCIESIWNSNIENKEIIVIDDGSTDDSVKLLNELAQQSPCPMTIISQKNTGNVALNLNRALAKTNGEFITLISLDDILYAGAIEKQFKIMSADNDIAFIANTAYIPIDSNGDVSERGLQTMRLAEFQSPTIDDIIDVEHEDAGAFFVQGCLFRKKIIDIVGGYDEDKLGDDIIIRNKIFQYIKHNPNIKFLVQNDPAFYYRFHDTNINKNVIRQVLIIVEAFEEFFSDRKNPKYLYELLRYTIRTCKYEDYMRIFAHNKLSSQLLLDAEILDAIREDIINSLANGNNTADCNESNIDTQDSKYEINQQEYVPLTKRLYEKMLRISIHLKALMVEVFFLEKLHGIKSKIKNIFTK